MPTPIRVLAILLVLGSLTPPSVAVEADDGLGSSDLERLFGEETTRILYSPQVEWRPGRGTVVWVDRSNGGNSRLMEYDPATGDRRQLLDDDRLTTLWSDRAGEPPTLEDPVWRPDGASLLVDNGEGPAVFDFATGALTVLSTGVGAEEHARFSPDGGRIAWVRDHDLWIYDFGLGRETRLTHDGSDTVFNGKFDWIYEEELAGREGRAFEWAADGSAIVWLRLDDSRIPVFHLVDLMDNHSRVTEQRYPKPGDPSPTPSLHVHRFDTPAGRSDRREILFDEPTPYVPRFGFTPTGGLWYQVLDRRQERLRLVTVDLAEGGPAKVLVDESDPHWIEPVDGLEFLGDGSFLWLSRRSGHMHLYRLQPDGSGTDLTPGAWDVTGVIGVDRAARWAWVEASRPEPAERRLFRVDLSNGRTVELTPAPGTHSGELSPSTERLLVRSASVAMPPRWKVTDGKGSGAAEIPVEHPIPRIDYGDHRFIEITGDDGLRFNAMLLLPPDFDGSSRYPVVVYTYGGPHAQVVRNDWPRTSGLFNHVLAGRGFVVFALDNRGSAARGRAFEGAADHALGSKQLPDQLAGVAWLRSQPWVDPERIGIWGWSYGGYMTAYALTHAPGVFAAGAAVAPVTDWRLYDSIYTERYMGAPEENPEGYAAGSVLDAVGELADPLLVIHGTGDDNVHVQHTMQLADRAWRTGVRFELALFPNLKHGINAPGSHLRVFGTIADFFDRHLMEGMSTSSGDDHD
jgi:dipeptidyl-peptidase-4